MSEAMTRVCGGRGPRVAATLVLPTVGLAALALVAAWPAAADTPAAEGRRTNLQVALWRTGIPGQAEALAQLVFSFQRRYPDVVVCLEWRDAELADEWLRRWCGGYRSHAPDVTVATDLWAWKHRGDIMRLPSDLLAEMIDAFEPAVLDRARGVPRGVPWAVATPALYYRADLLRDAELRPPRTPVELAECARELADPPHRFGLGVPGPGQGGEELLHALALGFTPAGDDEDEDAAIEERLERALELLVSMQAGGALQPEVLTWGEFELVEAFAQGRLGMVIGCPWAAQVLRQADAERAARAAAEGVEGDAAEPFEWAVAPLPVTDGGAGQVRVDWLIAFADTDRPENAMRFLRFMAERETQRALAMLCGAPAMTSLSRELADTPPWSGHIPALHDGAGLPLGKWPDLRVRLGEALYWALSGRLTPAEALQHAATEPW